MGFKPFELRNEIMDIIEFWDIKRDVKNHIKTAVEITIEKCMEKMNWSD